MTKSIILLILCGLASLGLVGSSTTCNEAICASVVSKCTLLKSCECDNGVEPTGCSCCKKCFACLEDLQAECCSCVGLCPSQTMQNATHLKPVRPVKSMVGDITRADSFNHRQLWEALMEGQDELGRWKQMTFPVDVDQLFVKKPLTSIQDTVIPQDLVTVNCTVAFLREEMSDTKCEKNCNSMGATSFRWFSNGCCQCVGHGCVNYGVNEARCGFSNVNEADQDEEINYDQLSDEELKALEDEYGLLSDAES